MSSQQKTLHQRPGSHPQQIKRQNSLQDRRSRVRLGQHSPSPPGTDALRTLAGLHPSQVHSYGCHRGHGRPLWPSPSSGLTHKARPILLRNAGPKDEATTQAPGSSNGHLLSAYCVTRPVLRSAGNATSVPGHKMRTRETNLRPSPAAFVRTVGLHTKTASELQPSRRRSDTTLFANLPLTRQSACTYHTQDGHLPRPVTQFRLPLPIWHH